MSMALLVWACTSKDAEPLVPYTFEDLKNLKMAPARVSVTASVSVTPSTVAPSAQATAVYNGIAAVVGGAAVPPAVTQAVADMNGVLGSAGYNAAAVAGGFTPAVVDGLTGTGVLPANLQTIVNTITADARFQPYLPVFSYPRINGVEITPTTASIGQPTPTAAVDALAVELINYTGNDPCFKSANDLFNQLMTSFESSRQGQIATIEGVFNQEKSAAEGEITGCLTDTQNKYKALVSSARTALDATVNNLITIRSTLGDAQYNTLLAFAYVQFSYQVKVYYNLQMADLNTCAITKTTRLSAAQETRVINTNAVNDSFNTAVKTGQNLVLRAYDSCHNQGTGR